MKSFVRLRLIVPEMMVLFNLQLMAVIQTKLYRLFRVLSAFPGNFACLLDGEITRRNGQNITDCHLYRSDNLSYDHLIPCFDASEISMSFIPLHFVNRVSLLKKKRKTINFISKKFRSIIFIIFSFVY